jgi:hypothetical protein
VREAILNAAADLFERERLGRIPGGAVTLDEIAQAAGLKQRQVREYFCSVIAVRRALSLPEDAHPYYPDLGCARQPSRWRTPISLKSGAR